MSPIVYRMNRPYLGVYGAWLALDPASSSLVDASQRSPAPEPRSRDPGAGGAGASRGGYPACLGGACVWYMQATQLLESWEQLIREEEALRAHQYGGYRPVWPVTSSVSSARGPRDCATKHYHQPRKALPAISLGTRHALGRSGRSGWRSAFSCGASRPIRVKPTYRCACSSKPTSNWQTTKHWCAIEGFPSDSSRWRDSTLCRPCSRELYGASGCPPCVYRKGRKPMRGALVRPLPRTYKGRTITATPPDRRETWQLGTGPTSLWLHADFWTI